MLRRTTALVFGVLAMTLLPHSAHAATEANYNLAYCDGGSYVGSGTNSLSNGTLSFGWCKTSTNKMTTLTVKYHKESGANINAVFGYEWVAADGSPTAGRHWDSTGSVTIQATQTWGARFRRDPAEAKPGSSTPCLRGLLKADGVVYSTRVVCP